MSVGLISFSIKTLKPVSSIIIGWYFFLIIFITLYLALLIVDICFEAMIAVLVTRAYDILLIIVLFLDMLLSFNTGFIRQGRLIMNKKQIAINYIKSVIFYADLISILVSLIQQIVLREISSTYRFFSLLVFFKVVKMYRFNVVIKRYIFKSSTALLYYQIIKYFFLLTFICHIFGSFFYLLDIFLYTYGYFPTQQLFIFGSLNYPNLYYSDTWIKYIYSLYFIVNTLSTVAYGDFYPLNQIEVIYIIVMMILPLLIFAYIFSIIYSTIAQKRQQRRKIRRLQLFVKNMFKSLGVNRKILYKVLNFIDYYYKNQIKSDEKFLSNLGPSIRQNYQQQSLLHKLDLTLFQHIEPNINVKVLSKVVKQQVYPISFIIECKKPQLIYLNQGNIIVYIKMNKLKYYKQIQQKQFIGKYQFFTGLINPFIKIQTHGISLCQVVTYQEYRNVIKETFPNLRVINSLFQEITSLWKDQILIKRKLNLINQSCFFCQEKNHILSECHHLRGSTSPNIQINLKSSCKGLYQLRTKVISDKIIIKKNIKNKLIVNEKRKQEFGIQVQIDVKEIRIQSISFWRQYQPQFNLI